MGVFLFQRTPLSWRCLLLLWAEASGVSRGSRGAHGCRPARVTGPQWIWSHSCTLCWQADSDPLCHQGSLSGFSHTIFSPYSNPAWWLLALLYRWESKLRLNVNQTPPRIRYADGRGLRSAESNLLFALSHGTMCKSRSAATWLCSTRTVAAAVCLHVVRGCLHQGRVGVVRPHHVGQRSMLFGIWTLRKSSSTAAASYHTSLGMASF